MKIKLVASSVCLLVLSMPGAALATTASAKNARKATYKEINNYEEPAFGIGKYEEENIRCSRLTATRYHCTFHFLSNVDVEYGCVAGDRGSSYVTFRRYGAEVNLHINNNVCVERHRR